MKTNFIAPEAHQTSPGRGDGMGALSGGFSIFGKVKSWLEVARSGFDLTKSASDIPVSSLEITISRSEITILRPEITILRSEIIISRFEITILRSDIPFSGFDITMSGFDFVRKMVKNRHLTVKWSENGQFQHVLRLLGWARQSFTSFFAGAGVARLKLKAAGDFLRRLLRLLMNFIRRTD
jgi:hypothetical protein